MSLERRLFAKLRKFIFEEDEAEVRAIIKREVRRSANMKGGGPEITCIPVNGDVSFTADQLNMLEKRIRETTGYAEPVDAPKPPASSGAWTDVWDRKP